MKPAIEIRNLGKRYRLATSTRYIALRDVISNSVKNIFSTHKKGVEEFWALQGIHLDIMPGERVGIIGRNGAGKSTLLKIISRITPPTTGEALIRGRVGSLLEVGTGFHPELTGHENIYLNGSILGLKKNEIDKQRDAIIDFSGVEKFIDTPLKHYSSGMEMRLAFSVAAHLRSEILLIDEVLAVGDMEFQKKCLGKMEEVSKEEGRTILFVSHNLAAVSTLTSKAILMDKGVIKESGHTAKVLSAYTTLKLSGFVFTAPPDASSPSVNRIELVTSEGGSIQAYGKPMAVIFEINMPSADTKNMALAFQVINRVNNQAVLHNWIFDADMPICRKKGINRIEFTFPEVKLYKGGYFLKVHLAESKQKTKYQEIEDCFFEVDMLNLPEPEWGWYDNMCLYLDRGLWQLKD